MNSKATLLVAILCGYISYIKFYSNITFQVVVFSNLITSLTYNAFFVIFADFYPILIYYLILIGVILVTFYFRFEYFLKKCNPIIVHCVSLLSSYMIVRGFSFIIGTYPDEGLIYELLSHKEFSQVHRYFYKEGYIYLTLILMLYGSFLVINKFMIKSTIKELEKEIKDEKQQSLIGGIIEDDNLIQSSEHTNSFSDSKEDSLEKNKDIIIEKN